MLKNVDLQTHTHRLPTHAHLIDPETLTVNIEAFLRRSGELSQFEGNAFVKIVERETK